MIPIFRDKEIAHRSRNSGTNAFKPHFDIDTFRAAEEALKFVEQTHGYKHFLEQIRIQSDASIIAQVFRKGKPGSQNPFLPCEKPQ